jgi:hypothetical protein
VTKRTPTCHADKFQRELAFTSSEDWLDRKGRLGLAHQVPTQPEASRRRHRA